MMRFAHSSSDALVRAFPTPEILFPRSAGIDISDASIKWAVLEGPQRGSLSLSHWGEIELPSGIITSGVVQNIDALSKALREVAKRIPHVHAAHAALPEEAAFIFNMNVPATSSRAQILSVVEFELDTRVPIPHSQAVYDFNELRPEGSEQAEVGVVVFPKDLAEHYADAFEKAGFTLLSLELEARSIARTVCDQAKDEVVLLVDFGGTRTGITVVRSSIPLFSSTVDIGGDAVTRALIENGGVSAEDADFWKNEYGLEASDDQVRKRAIEAISGIASALGDEIAKHYRYWDTRRDGHGSRVTPLSRVLLVGGSANLNGLPAYIASRVQAPVERPNIWKYVNSFENYVPPIDAHMALQYSTAIGLALRSFK